VRYHATVRTVGDLVDALDGVDPATPILWSCRNDYTLNIGQGEATVEARPFTVYIIVRTPAEFDFDPDLIEDGV
jgi:hypothetical protein